MHIVHSMFIDIFQKRDEKHLSYLQRGQVLLEICKRNKRSKNGQP